MVHDREVALRLVLAMIAHALVDGREVVEHLIGTVDGCLEMAQNIVTLSRDTQSVGMSSRVGCTARMESPKAVLRSSMMGLFGA